MFGKLKDKLKGALSVFSKKAEEEAEEILQPEETLQQGKSVQEDERDEKKDEPQIPAAEDLIAETKKKFADDEKRKKTSRKNIPAQDIIDEKVHKKKLIKNIP